MRAVYAGVRVRAFEGVVDTAAEEAVVGSQSFNGMREELRAAGLRPVSNSAAPPHNVRELVALLDFVELLMCPPQ